MVGLSYLYTLRLIAVIIISIPCYIIHCCSTCYVVGNKELHYTLKPAFALSNKAYVCLFCTPYPNDLIIDFRRPPPHLVIFPPLWHRKVSLTHRFGDPKMVSPSQVRVGCIFSGLIILFLFYSDCRPVRKTSRLSFSG